MTSSNLARRAVAEALGTLMLLTAIVGSGIMASKIAGGSDALALFGIAVPAGLTLAVMIAAFGPVSGGHFNPAVSLVFALRRELCVVDFVVYVIAQIAGACLGVMLSHAMFAEPIWQWSATVRTGMPLWIAEIVATFALATAVVGGIRAKSASVPWMVGAILIAGFWFTASSAFANPAVAIARAFTATLTGIAPENVLSYVIAECIGAVLALIVVGIVYGDKWCSSTEKCCQPK